MNFLDNISKLKKPYDPQSPAIITNEVTLTYSELQKQAVLAAGYLARSGITKDDFVPIICNNNKDFVIIVLALWLIDAIPVPVNIRLTSKEIEQLLSISGSTKILLHEQLVNKFNWPNQIVFPFTAHEVDELSINSITEVNNIAVVIFTSGSRGIPKGIMLSYRSLMNSAKNADRFLKHSTNDRWLASLPFYHIGGFSIITRTLLAGASMIIPATSDIGDFRNSLNKFKPTFASFVGTQLNRLIDDNIKPNKELRNILIGGGFIDEDLINSAIESGWKISKVYGSSETSSLVTALPFKDIKNRVKSSGKATQPNKIFIVDKQRKMLPPYSVGEIAVKSDTLFNGYLNNEKETSNKLVNDIYYTGDIGYLDEGGFLFVEARRTDMIFTGGENVNPLEVERQIFKHENVKDCCVVGLEDKTWGHIVAAAIVSDNKSFTQFEIQEYLKDKLAGFKIPKKILFVDQLPETSLGKIQKEKVLAFFENESSGDVSH